MFAKKHLRRFLFIMMLTKDLRQSYLLKYYVVNYIFKQTVKSLYSCPFPKAILIIIA